MIPARKKGELSGNEFRGVAVVGCWLGKDATCTDIKLNSDN